MLMVTQHIVKKSVKRIIINLKKCIFLQRFSEKILFIKLFLQFDHSALPTLEDQRGEVPGDGKSFAVALFAWVHLDVT